MPLFRGSARASSTPEAPLPPVEPALPAHADPEADAPLPRITHSALMAAWAAELRPLTPRGYAVEEALGLELCEDLVGDLDLPMLDVSDVDGVGVRAANVAGASEDHPIDLRLVAVLAAGDPPSAQTLPPGACVLLAPGAPVPAGVDAIVPRSRVTVTGRTVLVTDEATAGDHIRMRGSDLADGVALGHVSDVIGLDEQVRLVEAGLGEVLVRPRPRVGVLSLGANVLAPGASITTYTQRYAAPAALIAGLAMQQGAAVERLGVLGRDVEALREALRGADDLDLVVVVASSDADVLFAEDALADLASVRAAYLDAGDGLVLAYGRLGRAMAVIVPADSPSAAATGYETLLRPAIAMLSGGPWQPMPEQDA